jgi:hypothetical protein
VSLPRSGRGARVVLFVFAGSAGVPPALRPAVPTRLIRIQRRRRRFLDRISSRSETPAAFAPRETLLRPFARHWTRQRSCGIICSQPQETPRCPRRRPRSVARGPSDSQGSPFSLRSSQGRSPWGRSPPARSAAAAEQGEGRPGAGAVHGRRPCRDENGILRHPGDGAAHAAAGEWGCGVSNPWRHGTALRIPRFSERPCRADAVVPGPTSTRGYKPRATRAKTAKAAWEGIPGLLPFLPFFIAFLALTASRHGRKLRQPSLAPPGASSPLGRKSAAGWPAPRDFSHSNAYRHRLGAV